MKTPKFSTCFRIYLYIGNFVLYTFFIMHISHGQGLLKSLHTENFDWAQFRQIWSCRKDKGISELVSSMPRRLKPLFFN